MQRSGQDESGQRREQARRGKGRDGPGCRWNRKPGRTCRASRPALRCCRRSWHARLGCGRHANESDRPEHDDDEVGQGQRLGRPLRQAADDQRADAKCAHVHRSADVPGADRGRVRISAQTQLDQVRDRDASGQPDRHPGEQAPDQQSGQILPRREQPRCHHHRRHTAEHRAPAPETRGDEALPQQRDDRAARKDSENHSGHEGGEVISRPVQPVERTWQRRQGHDDQECERHGPEAESRRRAPA
jgi:hypothetical protein